ncbi:hypothetical protein AVEN_254355-1, partial [Araneus ventricosus]
YEVRRNIAPYARSIRVPRVGCRDVTFPASLTIRCDNEPHFPAGWDLVCQRKGLDFLKLAWMRPQWPGVQGLDLEVYGFQVRTRFHQRTTV